MDIIKNINMDIVVNQQMKGELVTCVILHHTQTDTEGNNHFLRAVVQLPTLNKKIWDTIEVSNKKNILVLELREQGYYNELENGLYTKSYGVSIRGKAVELQIWHVHAIIKGDETYFMPSMR
jgi:hypothetical protein